MAITITDLQRLAIKYQTDIRYLPYAVLFNVLSQLGITLYPGIQDTHKLIQFLRKRGIAKPYAPGITLRDSDVGKLKETPLKVETAYTRVPDNIKRYKEVTMVKPGEMIGSNKTKKHPFEVQLMMNMVRTFGEDILDALFSAERDLTDESPMGLFDGFETKILAAIVSGEISAAEKNLVVSAPMAAPLNEDDYSAYDNLVDWLLQADPYLLENCDLFLTRATARNCFRAMKNKTKQKAATFIDFKEYLEDDVDANINIKNTRFMGAGTRLYLTAPDNMDFGMNSMGDEAFVQIMPDNDDPNVFKYWIQGEFGTRWQWFHRKKFMTNDGALTANPLSGDYV